MKTLSTKSKDDVLNQFHQIEKLQRQAEKQYENYQQALSEVQFTLKQLSEVASHVSEYVSESSEIVGEFKAKRGPGRPPKVEGEAKRGPGRPPKVEGEAKRGPGRPPKVEGEAKRADNEISLKKHCWDLLDKNDSFYKKFFPEYPTDAYGLKSSELKTIIEKLGEWKSAASNVGAQIANALHSLKEAGKIHRNEEDRRYYIIEGAEYDS